MAFVPFAGTRDLSRSHFETQDHIELGQGAAGHDDGDGFLNRLLTQLHGDVRPIAFSAQLPLSLRGPRRVPNVVVAQAGRDAIAPRQQALLEAMWSGTAQEGSVREGFEVQSTVRRDMHACAWSREMRAASRGAVAPEGFVGEATPGAEQRSGLAWRLVRAHLGFARAPAAGRFPGQSAARRAPVVTHAPRQRICSHHAPHVSTTHARREPDADHGLKR